MIKKQIQYCGCLVIPEFLPSDNIIQRIDKIGEANPSEVFTVKMMIKLLNHNGDTDYTSQYVANIMGRTGMFWHMKGGHRFDRVSWGRYRFYADRPRH